MTNEGNSIKMPLEDIRNERIRKRAELIERGIDPYPAHTSQAHSIGKVIESFEKLAASQTRVTIAGRVMAKREHGGSTFFDLKDESGKIQGYVKGDILGESYALFLQTVDIGDFIEIRGKPFMTKKGERTIEADYWGMLAKSLRPLPEKWHGLQDVEERFRRRYLDLLINEEVKARMMIRSRVVRELRLWLSKKEFIEVETPMLHPIPGGALAKPFATRHNALDIDLYLRIAPELYLKRLLVGGFERIFEIGKCFRNEGIDPTHNPEFTMLELYGAWWDEEKMMKFVEDMFVSLAKRFGEACAFEFAEQDIHIKKPFTRITFTDVLGRYALIPNYHKETAKSMTVHAQRLGIDVSPGESKGKIADEVYKKICRPYLITPTFVIRHPLEISPLAKKTSAGAQNVRRFQLIIGGFEMVNGFAELNDPLDQRERFDAQARAHEAGDEEAHPIDEDFIEVLEYGMPPTAGIGVGIDRLVMLLTDTPNIKEVILFPTMKPKQAS